MTDKPDPHAPPTTKQELERKAVDLLTELAHEMEQDNIDMASARDQAHIIWKLTAGLVDREVSDLAEQLATQAASTARRERIAEQGLPEGKYMQILTPDGKYVQILMRHPGTSAEVRINYYDLKPELTVSHNTSAPWADIEVQTIPCGVGPERNRVLGKIISGLRDKGYGLVSTSL